MPPIDNPLAALESVRTSITGLRILDSGCGMEALANQLTPAGADVAGIAPEAQAIRDETKAAPQVVFVEGNQFCGHT